MRSWSGRGVWFVVASGRVSSGQKARVSGSVGSFSLSDLGEAKLEKMCSVQVGVKRLKLRSTEICQSLLTPKMLSDDGESGHPPLVFFDLETTGLSRDCEMVQLAAVSSSHSLNLYVAPQGRMDWGATRATGLTVRHHRLFLHKRPLLCTPPTEALLAFLCFIHMCQKPPQRPLLVGHNARAFDVPVLLRALERRGLRGALEDAVGGAVDSLALSRDLLRDSGVSSFKQEALVRRLLGEDYAAHDALQDARALQRLVLQGLKPRAEDLRRHTFSLGEPTGH